MRNIHTFRDQNWRPHRKSRARGRLWKCRPRDRESLRERARAGAETRRPHRDESNSNPRMRPVGRDGVIARPNVPEIIRARWRAVCGRLAGHTQLKEKAPRTGLLHWSKHVGEHEADGK